MEKFFHSEALVNTLLVGGPWASPEQVEAVVDGNIFSLMIKRTIFGELDSQYHKLQPENDTLISLYVLNAGILQKESVPPVDFYPAVSLFFSLF